jgi:hypothetical protein
VVFLHDDHPGVRYVTEGPWPMVLVNDDRDDHRRRGVPAGRIPGPSPRRSRTP